MTGQVTRRSAGKTYRRQSAATIEQENMFTVAEYGQLVGRRDARNCSRWDSQIARFRTAHAIHGNLAGIALPFAAVNDGLSVVGEARGFQLPLAICNRRILHVGFAALGEK